MSDFNKKLKHELELVKQKNKLLLDIINTIPEPIIAKDWEGNFIFANSFVAQLYNTSPEEMLGKEDTYFTGNKEQGEFFKNNAQAIMTKFKPEMVLEDSTDLKTGDIRHYHSLKIPFKNADDELNITIFAKDITDVTRLKNMAEKNEKRLKHVLSVSAEGMWDWNIKTNDIVHNRQWEIITGIESNKQAYEKFKHCISEDDKQKVYSALQNLLEKNERYDVEFKMTRPDGKVVWLWDRGQIVERDLKGKPVWLVGTLQDITQRKKMEFYDDKNSTILELIAIGHPAPEIYDAIALMFEERHSGMRCSMLELHGKKLLHGGAPSLPKDYCDAVHGLEYGPEIGSCGTSTYTGKRCIVENIETDPKWAELKQVALPYGLKSCWSEPIFDPAGKVLGAFGMYYDHPATPNEEESKDLKAAARLAGIVMTRDQYQKSIRQLAFYDELTGLANRSHIYQEINKKIAHCKLQNQRFSLLYIDLDNFKDINDSLGHDRGDLLLKEVAKRLNSVIRDIDFVGRLSGDEFCLLVNVDKEKYGSEHIAQLCLDSISQPIELSSQLHTPSCSIGIAHFPDNGKDITSLIKAADTALYQAKGNGKNCYALYSQTLSQKAEYRFQLEQNLREAIDNQQLTLVYQPQIDTLSGEIIGVEALSRWHHPSLGDISPCEFIPIAEKIGLIKPLTHWVLTTACKQVIKWRLAGLHTIRMSINISPSHFLDEEIVTLIKNTISKTGINASELGLEVTESVTQTDTENLIIFKYLKELGISLAIDDFGTGYSSFSSLKHLDVDYLKIDKYFIDDLVTDKKSRLLVKSMIEMGHALGNKIIAEGIETQEQFNILKELGCNAIQGYLFSKPVNADQIEKRLKTNMAKL